MGSAECENDGAAGGAGGLAGGHSVRHYAINVWVFSRLHVGGRDPLGGRFRGGHPQDRGRAGEASEGKEAGEGEGDGEGKEGTRREGQAEDLVGGKEKGESDACSQGGEKSFKKGHCCVAQKQAEGFAPC